MSGQSDKTFNLYNNVPPVKPYTPHRTKTHHVCD